MTEDRLVELKALQRERGHGPLFPTHLDFQKWVDQVAPLLSFDPALKASFVHCARSADVSHNLGSADGSYSNINRAVGIVNQAVRTLELSAQQPLPATEAPSSGGIKPPDKLTVKWLYEHVPMSFFFWLCNLLVAAFALGVLFSETPLYSLLKSTVVSNTAPAASAASHAK